MKEQQEKRAPKPGGKPAGKNKPGNQPVSKKPFLQVGKITSALPAIRFPNRHADTTTPETPAAQEISTVDLPVSNEPPAASISEKISWRKYLVQRIQKNWLFFILNLIGIIGSFIVGWMAMNRLFFLQTGQYPLIHFEMVAGEASPKVWYLINIPTTAWFTVWVASISCFISSIVLMVMFWLPNEPEDTVKRHRNWQIYSMFIQIFAFIFLAIHFVTSLGIK